MQRRTLVLFTHSLGELVTTLCREAVSRASHEFTSCAVLINDIGFADRFEIYLRHGIEGVVGDYIHRKTCAERDLRICQIGQIPMISEIPRLLDIAVYERSKMLLRQLDTALYSALIGDKLKPSARGEYIELMREFIVPTLVTEYIEANWKFKPIVYLERKQRNRSMRLLKCRRGSYNWCEVRNALQANPLNAFVLEEIDPRLLRGKSGTPRCRAILLALFDEISLSYDELLIRASTSARVAWEEAQEVYLKVAKGLPEGVPYRPRWSLSFRNEFWEEA